MQKIVIDKYLLKEIINSSESRINSLMSDLKSTLLKSLQNDGIVLINIQNKADLDEDKIKHVFLSISTCLGVINELYGKLYDVKLGSMKYKNENYNTISHLNSIAPLHTDGSWLKKSPDIIGLACIHQAKMGGETIYADVRDLVEEIRGSEIEKILTKKFARETASPGETYDLIQLKSNEIPILEFIPSLKFRYMRRWIECASDRLNVPFSEEEINALDFCDNFFLKNKKQQLLNSGDIIFVNNSIIVHSRNPFTEYTEPEGRPRHFVRSWINYTLQ